MNQAQCAVMIDSGSDVPESLAAEYDIRIVRLKVMYKDQIFSDGLDITPEYVYDHFPNAIPKTSTPNGFEIAAIIDKIRRDGYDKIIGISISSGLSGTYSAMEGALREAGGLKTFMFDSRNISIGSGLLGIWAADQLSRGKSFEEVTAGLPKMRDKVHLGFYMDTLDYLRAGGRITPSVAIVGKILHLKPIISCNREGVYHTIAKIRGQSKGIQKLIDTVVPEGVDGRKTWIALMNGRGSEFARRAKEEIRRRVPEANFLVEKQITATMAIHTGPGLLGIAVLETEPGGYPAPTLGLEIGQVQEKLKETIDGLVKKP